MRRYLYWIAVCAATALITASGAEPGKEAPPLRLELDLVDGSHLIGTPGLATVPLQTSYNLLYGARQSAKYGCIGQHQLCQLLRGVRGGQGLQGLAHGSAASMVGAEGLDLRRQTFRREVRLPA